MRRAAAAVLVAACGMGLGLGEEAAPAPIIRTGDLLLRLEAVNGAPNPLTAEFERARLRLRPGIEAPLAGGRLTLGAGLLGSLSTDGNDENEIRNDNFNSDEVALDRAYARLSGRTAPLSATFGVHEAPVAGTEMLWDRDIRFHGLSLGAELPSGALASQRVIGGWSIGSHDHEDESRAAFARWEGETRAALSFGAAFWHFAGTDALVAAGYSRTNRLAPGGEDYLSDYEVGHVNVGWEWLGERRPVRVRADWMHNFGADDLREAGELRVDWGEIQGTGSWRLRGILQRVEQDAVLAAFGGDEWWFRTRQRGARLGFAAGLGANVVVELSALVQRRDDLDDWLTRIWVDVAVPL